MHGGKVGAWVSGWVEYICLNKRDCTLLRVGCYE